MPPQPLVERALAAAIVVLLTVAGVVALTGGPARELALGLERSADEPVRAGTGTRAGSDVLASRVTVPAGARAEAALATTSPTTSPTTAPVVGRPATGSGEPTTTTAPAPTSPPTTSPPPTSPTTAAPTTTTQAPAGTARDGACETSMLGWMNEARAEAGREPLTEDEAIQHVSLDWSTHMAGTGELAHNPRFSEQIFAARPEAMTAGEVVGWSDESARAVFEEFLRSSVHRDTIRQRAFRHATVGCVRDAAGRLWVTGDFWG